MLLNVHEGREWCSWKCLSEWINGMEISRFVGVEGVNYTLLVRESAKAHRCAHTHNTHTQQKIAGLDMDNFLGMGAKLLCC